MSWSLTRRPTVLEWRRGETVTDGSAVRSPAVTNRVAETTQPAVGHGHSTGAWTTGDHPDRLVSCKSMLKGLWVVLPTLKRPSLRVEEMLS
jgi:hypothetical protein